LEHQQNLIKYRLILAVSQQFGEKSMQKSITLEGKFILVGFLPESDDFLILNGRKGTLEKGVCTAGSAARI
jgi:hypothetical protein